MSNNCSIQTDFTVTDALIVSEHVTTDALVVSEHVTTDALVTSEHATTDALVTSEHVTTDALVVSEHVTTDALLATANTNILRNRGECELHYQAITSLSYVDIVNITGKGKFYFMRAVKSDANTGKIIIAIDGVCGGIEFVIDDTLLTLCLKTGAVDDALIIGSFVDETTIYTFAPIEFQDTLHIQGKALTAGTLFTKTLYGLD